MSSNALYQRGQFLASVLSPRISSLNGSHSMFANERRRRPSIQFSFSSKKDSEEEVAEPPAKRRRVQRRNSKTAAMLLNSVSSAIMSDLSSDDAEKSTERKDAAGDNADPWETSVEIAGELVRELNLKRKNHNMRIR